MKEFKNDPRTSEESRGTRYEPRTPKKPPEKGTKVSSTCHKPPEKGKKGPKEIDVSSAIDTVLEKLRRNPYLLHSEFDMQAMLYMELLKMDNGLYPTGIKKNDNEFMETQRVHRDYPYAYLEGKGLKIDIVVFDSNVMDRIKGVKKQKHSLAVGTEGEGVCKDLIEMKFARGSLKTEKEEMIYTWDMKKLKSSYERFNLKPNLYFLLYIYWEITAKADIPEHLNTLRDLLQKANESPVINYYLLIGPKNNWEGILNQENLLNEYKKAKNAELTFFI